MVQTAEDVSETVFGIFVSNKLRPINNLHFFLGISDFSEFVIEEKKINLSNSWFIQIDEIEIPNDKYYYVDRVCKVLLCVQ